MASPSKIAALAVAGVAVLPPILAAPRPVRPGPGVDELEQRCRTSGLSGWELVEFASELVGERISQHSIWHLWESPARSVRNGRGWAAQYNAALADLLGRLGFRTELVHAARVRGLGANPWWQAGHTWVRVSHQGRTRDVTALRDPDGRGQAPLVPVSEVRPVHPWTPATVTLALAPVAGYQAWKSLLRREPVPSWMYRDL